MHHFDSVKLAATNNVKSPEANPVGGGTYDSQISSRNGLGSILGRQLAAIGASNKH